ncbi:hypothetical protein TIFTF001_037911 [Ficus carica]|uniref:Uncharacterized protein n=1 Tax=Ficus carica TaxID=3494 RepID=A0AA88E717_FICCA|nr:hypothetical protein TIFTF001_037911 [Ficus carica]
MIPIAFPVVARTATLTCDSRSRQWDLVTSFNRRDSPSRSLVNRKYKLLVGHRDLASSPWGSRHSHSGRRRYVA